MDLEALFYIFYCLILLGEDGSITTLSLFKKLILTFPVVDNLSLSFIYFVSPTKD